MVSNRMAEAFIYPEAEAEEKELDEEVDSVTGASILDKRS